MPGKSSPHLVLLIVVLLSIIPQLTLAQPNQNFSVSLSAIPAPSLDELRYLDNVIAFMNGVEGFHPVSSVPGCAAKQAHTCVPFAGRNWFPLLRRAQIACGTFGYERWSCTHVDGSPEGRSKRLQMLPKSLSTLSPFMKPVSASSCTRNSRWETVPEPCTFSKASERN